MIPSSGKRKNQSLNARKISRMIHRQKIVNFNNFHWVHRLAMHKFRALAETSKQLIAF
jgi:hypothetical protein